MILSGLFASSVNATVTPLLKTECAAVQIDDFASYCFKADCQLTCTAIVVSMAVGARKTTRNRWPSFVAMYLFRRCSASIFTLNSGLGGPAENEASSVFTSTAV